MGLADDRDRGLDAVATICTFGHTRSAMNSILAGTSHSSRLTTS
jgi:hypothetical protein